MLSEYKMITRPYMSTLPHMLPRRQHVPCLAEKEKRARVAVDNTVQWVPSEILLVK